MTMKHLFLFAFILPYTSLAQESDEAAIRHESAQFSASYVAGDFEAMTNHYTEDAILMSPARDVIEGRKGILAFWQSTTKPVMHRSEPDRIVIEGNLAHDYGYFYTQSQKPGEVVGPVASAKYYILWAKDAQGRWRMKMDMWNSRRPDWNK